MDIRVVPGGDTQRGEAQRGIKARATDQGTTGSPRGRASRHETLAQVRKGLDDEDRTKFCLPSMWFGICFETGLILGAYFWLRMKGDAPSMWHILVRSLEGRRDIWGTCAIYVGIPSLILANEWDLRQLCPRKAAWCWGKNVGATQGKKLHKICFFRDIHGANYLFEMELHHLSPAFCLWHRWRKSRNWAIYFETGVVHCLGTGFETMKYARFCSGFFTHGPSKWIPVNLNKL